MVDKKEEDDADGFNAFFTIVAFVFLFSLFVYTYVKPVKSAEENKSALQYDTIENY